MSEEKRKLQIFGQYLSVSQLVIYLGLSRSYIEHNWPDWAATGKVRTYRLRRKLLFHREDIDRMMETRFKISL